MEVSPERLSTVKRGLMFCKKSLLSVAFVFLGILAYASDVMPDSRKQIEIFQDNAAYWQYDGKPVLLIGGSVEDNLFQIPNLESQLDLLKSVGGNYVRNTMSSRDQGNVWPFKQVDGQYDLDQWNGEYWRRFENLLELSHQRDIIVQIEVWATFDFYRKEWEVNPFNPKKNASYSAEKVGLPENVNSHPTACENNFFWSVPAHNDQKTVLKYQRLFVDKLLSYSLDYGNVLYCMDNETCVTGEWGKFWSEYIKGKAGERGFEVQTTEMWDRHLLSNPNHKGTFEAPETYSFVDISQNNWRREQTHWDNGQRYRARVANDVRPLNNVKIYGSDKYSGSGGDRQGVERFWRNIFGGMASARFHRPPAGLGLNETAQASIRSARLLADRMDVFASRPHNELLFEREPNEAYCMADPGKEYAVFFPLGGQIGLHIGSSDKPLFVRWLNILKCQWQEPQPLQERGSLRCPSQDYWVALVQLATTNTGSRLGRVPVECE